MPTMSAFQKGWALRYIREAKAELIAAQKTPSIANSLVTEAVRKAQAAIYYSLGDPAFVESIVYQAFYNHQQPTGDPVLKCLVGIEHTIQSLSQMPDSESRSKMQQADNVVQIATDIVELFTGEKA